MSDDVERAWGHLRDSLKEVLELTLYLQASEPDADEDPVCRAAYRQFEEALNALDRVVTDLGRREDLRAAAYKSACQQVLQTPMTLH